MITTLVLVLASLAMPGCIMARRDWRPLFGPPVCHDGLPVQVLQHAACVPDGFCGWSCLPGRWNRETTTTPDEGGTP